jgi:hypothetical protein
MDNPYDFAQIPPPSPYFAHLMRHSQQQTQSLQTLSDEDMSEPGQSTAKLPRRGTRGEHVPTMYYAGVVFTRSPQLVTAVGKSRASAKELKASAAKIALPQDHVRVFICLTRSDPTKPSSLPSVHFSRYVANG